MLMLSGRSISNSSVSPNLSLKSFPHPTSTPTQSQSSPPSHHTHTHTPIPTPPRPLPLQLYADAERQFYLEQLLPAVDVLVKVRRVVVAVVWIGWWRVTGEGREIE